MAETKHIYRMVPCPAYRIELFQTWLEDLAREGLILEPDTFLFGIATFTRQSPQHLRYRLEPAAKHAGSMNEYDTPDYRAAEIYQAFGWEYVARYGQFYIYRCADSSAPELHTDPFLQELSLGSLKKRTRTALLTSIFNILFFCWLNMGFILTIACAFVGTPLVAAGILILLESFMERFFEWFHLHRLCLKMKQGDSPVRKTDWRKSRFLFRTRSILAVILPLLWFLAMFTNKSDAEYPLGDYPYPLPFSTLAEVFPDAEVTIDDTIVGSDVQLYSDPLIPETIEYRFYGDVKFDSYNISYASLHVNYHRTAAPFLARQLVREYQRHAARSNRIFSKSDRIPYDVSNVQADAIVCYNEGISVILILCKGSEVLRCTYLNRGHDTDPEIEHFAQVMAASIG